MLDNLRVVITGVCGSLGQATAAKARLSGAHVIGLDIVDTESAANTDEYHKVDLMNRGATLSCFGALGKVDVLINIAGGFAMGDEAFDTTSEQWDAMFRINVDTMRNATMGAVPLLKAQGGGAIVNIVDIHAQRPLRDHPVYGPAKAALAMLTRSLAKDLAPDIRVNGVSPGAILWPEDGMSAATQQTILQQVPLKRAGAPDDIAGCVLFLLRDAPYVTGQIIAVDGGRSIGW